jgi:N-acetylmuramoyl-L-alanine amidase
MKRHIKYIVVHCTATPPEATIESIRRYWREHLGWKNPGYHYIIKRNGEIVSLHPENQVANGVKDYNKNALHLCYIGGIDPSGVAADNRTAAQKEAMFDKLMELSEKYPSAIILGHRDFPGVTKRCPSFDVRKWLSEYTPDLRMAA